MQGSKFAKIGRVSATDKLEIYPSPLVGEGRVRGSVIAGLTRNLAVKPLLSENIFSLKKSWQSTEVI
jgi:hypothetical protein